MSDAFRVLTDSPQGVGKLGEELLSSSQSEAILNQLAGNVHGGILKRYELMSRKHAGLPTLAAQHLWQTTI